MKTRTIILLLCISACVTAVAQQPADTTNRQLGLKEAEWLAGDADTLHPAAEMSKKDMLRQQLRSQQVTPAASDTTAFIPTPTDTKSLSRAERRMRRDSMRLNWKPIPARATWLAVVVPGLGQIYNKKYWKLPIIYGGFMGCAYAISWNGKMYHDYKNAYRDIIDSDPNTTSYLNILPQGYTVEMMGGITAYTATLQSRQQRYHRYRDIGIVAAVAVYALSIIDAFVDAQLYDFDISPDLTMSVAPTIHYDRYCENKRTTELQFSLRF